MRDSLLAHILYLNTEKVDTHNFVSVYFRLTRYRTAGPALRSFKTRNEPYRKFCIYSESATKPNVVLFAASFMKRLANLDYSSEIALIGQLSSDDTDKSSL